MGNSDYEFLRDWALKQEPFEDIDDVRTDRDRLAAENAELRRRLEAIKDECFCTREVCARTILAIAEGRDNG